MFIPKTTARFSHKISSTKAFVLTALFSIGLLHAPSAYAQNFEPTLPDSATCLANISYFFFDAATTTTYIPGRDEDGQYTLAEALIIGGWTELADGTLVRPAVPAPDATAVFQPNVINGIAGDINLENNTSITDNSLAVTGFLAAPGLPRTVTITDVGGFETQRYAAFDIAGNLVSNVVTGPRGNGSNGTNVQTLTIPVVPASGEFFVFAWRTDIDQFGSVGVPACGADLITTKALPVGAPSSVNLGDIVTFEIVVENTGPESAQNVSLKFNSSRVDANGK